MEAQEFTSSRQEIARRPGLDGPGRRAALTDLSDTWLAELFDAAEGLVSQPFCLVAVGGYGRGELTIGSDLDVVLLHKSGPDEAARAAEALWYPIWDSGVRLDHSVRTVSEARRMAADDIKVQLGLLDARVIAGDVSLAEQLSSAIHADWRAMAKQRLGELHALVRDRRETFGEATQLSEPNLKESYGALRDVTVLEGICASWVTDVPRTGWQAAAAHLLDVRDALHRVTGRPQDVLLLQEQDAVADELLGEPDADALLRDVYSHARTIAYASDVAWHRVERLIAERPRRSFRQLRRKTPDRVPLADGVVLQNGEAVLALEAKPQKDASLALRAAAAAAQAGVLLSPHTVERLATEGADLPVPWRRSDREAFISLLGSGSGLVPVWEALDHAGLIERWLPGWEAVRSVPQRNALHRFTVDRHLVETAVQAGSRTRNVDRPDLLLVGALLHDIGKGRGGDHSEVGAVIALDLAQRMGFDPQDAAIIAILVRYHLLLPDTATKRDLEDRAVVRAVADVLGDVEALDLMHELTIADAHATGPTVSTDWRFGLIRDLVRRVRAVMDGRPAPQPPELTEQQRVALSHSGVWVLMEEQDGIWVVTVAARDQLGLMGQVAGVLSLNRLNVLAARITTVDGRAVQEWTVRPAFGDPPALEQLSLDIRRAVEGTYDVADRLAKREEEYSNRPPAGGFPEPAVTVVRTGSGNTGVVEVRAHDAPGLLYRVTRAVAAADVDITGAKVSTVGSDAVDAFFVRHPDGNELTEERLAALRTTVLSSMGAAPV